MLRTALGCFLVLAAATGEAQNLMPWPAKVVPSTGALKIDAGFRIEVVGPADSRIRAAAARFEHDLEVQTGVPLRKDRTPSARLRIEYAKAGSALPALGEDESYELAITPAGAVLRAREAAGVLPGLQTFLQLIVPGPEGFEIRSIAVEDKPRFPWRGLMLDAARHFMPVEVVERNLRAMAAAKLNVLHWHLSDDQGFRIECERLPKLYLEGAEGKYYTRAQVRHVVEYAAERGIRVVPEFDVPGHTSAMLTAYPELGSAPGPYKIERLWGIFRPTLDPTRDETYQFLDALLDDVTPLFPDRYFHIGGDEVEETQWKQSASIQAFAQQRGLHTTADLHAYFNERLQQLLAKHNKTMVGWDEVLRPNLAAGTVIQSWRGQASLAAAARQGFQGILSFGYYLDHLRPAAYHYGIDPMDGEGDRLSGAEASRILGGEACMWSEYTTEETVDSRIWPRLLAIAERLWSARNVKDVGSMYARMESAGRWLEFTGIHDRSNYLPMIERIVGRENPVEPLEVLADAIETAPVQVRRDTRKYDSLFPLNRLVDAARIESEPIRTLQLAADHLAAGRATPEEVATLRQTFTMWRDNHARLAPLGAGNALIREVLPLSAGLSELGSIGLAALALQAGKDTASDRDALERRLRDVTTDAAEVTLAAIRPVRTVVDAGASGAGAGPARAKP